MMDWTDSKTFWDILKSVNKLLSYADTKSEVLGIEKALCFEIRCVAAAYENEVSDHAEGG